MELSFNGPLILSAMYHLSAKDLILLKMRLGFNNVHILSPVEFKPQSGITLENAYSIKLRATLGMKGALDEFQSILFKILPEALPMCYLETYRYHKDKVNKFSSLKVLMSSVGWNNNGMFKLLAAESLLRGAKLIEVQHGGGYGMWLNIPGEKFALEKDYFYSWGWGSYENKKIKTMPSPYLSGLKDTHLNVIDKILFIGNTAFRYKCRFASVLFSDDVPKYFNDKKTFYQKITTALRGKILYRPYSREEWNEQKFIASSCPDVGFVTKGRLVEWMRKAKIVVIDQPYTSFLEALTINVPSVFYWDHEVFMMRPEAEPYFQALREVGILYKDPASAAEKVNEIFDNPGEWWLSNRVQDAREEFCDRFAYARKDWLEVWVKELKKFI
jgi:putative transferase (TIGR04331 family)